MLLNPSKLQTLSYKKGKHSKFLYFHAVVFMSGEKTIVARLLTKSHQGSTSSYI